MSLALEKVQLLVKILISSQIIICKSEIEMQEERISPTYTF